MAGVHLMQGRLLSKMGCLERMPVLRASAVQSMAVEVVSEFILPPQSSNRIQSMPPRRSLTVTMTSVCVECPVQSIQHSCRAELTVLLNRPFGVPTEVWCFCSNLRHTCIWIGVCILEPRRLQRRCRTPMFLRR